MSQKKRFKLLGRFLMLAVLLAGVISVWTDDKRIVEAASAECCYTCEAKYNRCQASSNPSGCMATVNYCFNHCLPCEYEGGSLCNGPQDCISGSCVNGYCDPY